MALDLELHGDRPQADERHLQVVAERGDELARVDDGVLVCPPQPLMHAAEDMDPVGGRAQRGPRRLVLEAALLQPQKRGQHGELVVEAVRGLAQEEVFVALGRDEPGVRLGEVAGDAVQRLENGGGDQADRHEQGEPDDVLGAADIQRAGRLDQVPFGERGAQKHGEDAAAVVEQGRADDDRQEGQEERRARQVMAKREPQPERREDDQDRDRIAGPGRPAARQEGVPEDRQGARPRLVRAASDRGFDRHA